MRQAYALSYTPTIRKTQIPSFYRFTTNLFPLRVIHCSRILAHGRRSTIHGNQKSETTRRYDTVTMRAPHSLFGKILYVRGKILNYRPSTTPQETWSFFSYLQIKVKVSNFILQLNLSRSVKEARSIEVTHENSKSTRKIFLLFCPRHICGCYIEKKILFSLMQII